MYHIFFICSSVDRHLGCFYVLTIVNIAAIHTGVHVSFRIVAFSGYMHGIVGLLGHVVDSFLVCLLFFFLKGFAVVLVQLPNHVLLIVTPWTAAGQASLSLTISWSFPKFMSIESVVPSNHLILCCHLLLLPSIFPSMSLS